MLRRLSLVFLVALLGVSCDENPAQPEATVTTADALFSSQADNPIVHRLTVGGADAEFYGPPGSDANFSLIAIQRADGSTRGQWSDQYGGAGMHAEIDCLYVDGNTAWVSGPVTKHTNPDLVGRTANAQVRDGGDTGADMVSPVFFYLPLTCVDQPGFEGAGLFWPVNNGQVKLN